MHILYKMMFFIIFLMMFAWIKKNCVCFSRNLLKYSLFLFHKSIRKSLVQPWWEVDFQFWHNLHNQTPRRVADFLDICWNYNSINFAGLVEIKSLQEISSVSTFIKTKQFLKICKFLFKNKQVNNELTKV